MTSFTTLAAAPLNGAADPTKHVNYVQGMILGVDDLTQEFAYLAGRDQSLARDLIGYGTVAGLDVSIEVDARTQVVVGPGVALSPRGEIIRIERAQCADLAAWIGTNRESLGGLRRDGVASIYVVLAYRICLTDDVPIPGEPCRSEDEALAASRVADDFQLELALQPPDQSEEDAVRAFVGWLSRVQLDEGGTDALTLEEFLEQIRLAADLGSPPGAMDDLADGSPPLRLRIPAGQARDYLRAAFRYWTTDLRPRWWSAGPDSAGHPPSQGHLLLAALRLPLTDDLLLDPVGQIVIDEGRRPYLVHLRMLQEWLISGALTPSDTVTAETGYGQPPDHGTAAGFNRADHTHGTPPPPTLLGDVRSGPLDPDQGVLATHIAWLQGWRLAAAEPRPGDLLTFVSDEASPPEASPPEASPPEASPPEGLVVDRPPLGIERPGSIFPRLGRVVLRSPTEFTPPAARTGGHWEPAAPGGDVQGAIGDLSVVGIGNIPVVLPEDPQPGQVLTLRESDSPAQLVWQPEVPPAAGGALPPFTGDVSSTLQLNVDNPRLRTRVESLQGNTLAASDPSDGNVLTFREGQWRPETPAAGGALPPFTGDVSGVIEQNEGGPQLFTTVENLQGNTLAAADPSEGNVLTFSEGAWRPAGPGGGSIILAGDVTGDPGGTVVVGLQKIPVAETPEPSAGQVLTLGLDERERLVWRPASPPTGGSPVVGAARFDSQGNVIETFNKTQAFQLDRNLFLISFNGFEPGNFYIMKGTPGNSLNNSPAIFEVISQDDGGLRDVLARASPPFAGIAVRVMQINGEPVPFGFMVEISQFTPEGR